MTKRLMDREGINYSVTDLSQDEGAMDYVRRLGYQSAPVVVMGENHWSGFRPERVKGLKVAQ